MLRGVGLFEVQLLDQLAGREFAFAQSLDDGDAGGMGEALKDSSFELAKFVVSLYISIFDYGYVCWNGSDEPNRTRARELAAESRRLGRSDRMVRTAVSEQEQGSKVVPWADLGANPNLPAFDGDGEDRTGGRMRFWR